MIITIRRLRAIAVLAATATLAGCGGTQDGPDVVRGRVVNWDRTPAPGVEVILGAQRTTTGADGAYRFAGVGASYDLHLADMHNVTSRLGLTLRRVPDLLRPVEDPAHPYPREVGTTMTIRGTVTGGSLSGAGRFVAVTFCTTVGCQTVRTQGDAFAFYLGICPEDGPQQGTLYALEGLADERGVPTAWGRYGTVAAVPIIPDPTYQTVGFAQADVQLAAPVASRTISARFDAPPAYTLPGVAFYLWNGTDYLDFHVMRTTGTIDALAVPILSGFTAEYVADNESTDAYADAYGSIPDGSVAIKLPEQPALVAPADGASDVSTDTEFAWTGRADAVYTFSATCTGMTRQVWTTAASARLFALDDHPVRPATGCIWWVNERAPHASMDALLSTTGASPRPARTFVTTTLRRFAIP